MIYIDDKQTVSTDSDFGTTETTEPQVEEQTQAETQTPEPEVQDDQESFFDPQSIPEELKPAYKQMQAAFTKKTQEIATQRKQAEEWKQQAEEYQKYQQHIPIIEEMLRSQKQNTNPELQALEDQYRKAGYSDEAIDMMKMGIGYALNHFNQTNAAQQQQAWITQQVDAASKVDSRLTDPSLVYKTEDGDTVTFGQMVESVAMADPSVQQDPVAATKRAIKRVDALIGRAKTEGKTELSEAAKSRARKFPSTSSSPQGTSDASETGSIAEIGKQVMAELGMK